MSGSIWDRVKDKYTFLSSDKKTLIISLLKYLVIIFGIFYFSVFVFTQLSKIGLEINASLLTIVFAGIMSVMTICATVRVLNNFYVLDKFDANKLQSPTANAVSKIISLYIFEFVTSLFYSLTVLIALGLAGHMTYTYFLVIVFISFFLPMFAIALALLISIPVMQIKKHFARHSVISALSVILICGAVIVLYAFSLSQLFTLFQIVDSKLTVVQTSAASIDVYAGYFKIFSWISNAIITPSKFYIPVALSFGVLLFAFLACFAASFYAKNKMQTKQISQNFSYAEANSFKDILKQEFKLNFSNYHYITNNLFFLILLPVLLVCFCYLLLPVAQLYSSALSITAVFITIAVLCICFANFSLSSTISRDFHLVYKSNNNFAYVKKVILCKILFNLILIVAGLIIAAPFLYYYTNLSLLQILLGMLIALFVGIAHMLLTIYVDLKSPVYDFTVGKININNILCLCFAGLFTFAICIAGILLSPFGWIMWVCLGALVVLAIVIFAFLIKKCVSSICGVEVNL